MCGACCYDGFFDSKIVSSGVIDLGLKEVIIYLQSKGLIFDVSKEGLYSAIKPFEQSFIAKVSNCLFLDDNKCVIHPSIIGVDIRGDVCGIRPCFD